MLPYQNTYLRYSLTRYSTTDDYWNNLTPERAFLARVYIEHCVNIKDNDRLESALPVVTLLAFRIQQEYNALLQLLGQVEAKNNREPASDDEEEKKDVNLEEKAFDAELVVGELLGLAVNLDYADEIGRRKMFQLIRTYLQLLCARSQIDKIWMQVISFHRRLYLRDWLTRA